MKQNLDDYIKKNRNALDVEEPDDQFIWEGIEREVKKGSRRAREFFYAAAALLILFGVSWGLNQTVYKKEASRVHADYFSNFPDELKDERMQFVGEIDLKLKEIEEYQIDKEKYNEFYKELEFLDQLNEDFLKDLDEVGNNPRLMRAMLAYYEMKIRILEQLVIEIEKNKKYENTKNPEEVL